MNIFISLSNKPVFYHHLSLEKLHYMKCLRFSAFRFSFGRGVGYFPAERLLSFNVIFQKKFSSCPLLLLFDSHHCWVMPRVILLKSKLFLCSISAQPMAECISKGLGTYPFIRYKLNSVSDVSGTRVRCRSLKKYERENQQL